MPLNCTTDANGCVTCPLIEGAPFVPSSLELLSNVGWNAGGNSVAEIAEGNLHLIIPAPMNVAGVYCGLRRDRVDPTTPSRIAYAFYFTMTLGVNFWLIRENGYTHGIAIERVESDTFEIRRIGSVVTYLVNDVEVYRSLNPSYGRLLVTGCLYLSGDAIE